MGLESQRMFNIIGGELMKYVSYTEKCKLDEEETQKFMRQIVSAVDHLHRAGIIHRYRLHVHFITIEKCVFVSIVIDCSSNKRYMPVQLSWCAIDTYYTAICMYVLD